MATRQRAVDRGAERGIDLIRTIGREIRLARRNSGLSLARVAREARISSPELSRIERGLAPWVSLALLAQLCAIVGLDLTACAFPGASPLRDARHAALLERFHRTLHHGLRWQVEVPLPHPGDQRAWDGMVSGAGWRYGIEAELNPIDGQAIIRRVKLKQRDGGVDGVLLLLPDTRQTRLFRREFAEPLTAEYPIGGRQAMELLAAGADPSGSAIVVL